MSRESCAAEPYRRAGSLRNAISAMLSRSPCSRRRRACGRAARARAISSAGGSPARNRAALGRSGSCSQMAPSIS